MLAAALAVAALLLAPAAAPAADAVAVQQDPGHTGVSPESLRSPLRRVWSRVVPGTVAHALIVRGRVLVAANDLRGRTTVMALSARDGRILWQQVLGEGRAGIAAAGDRLFVVDDGVASALDVRTGRRFWSQPLPADASSCGTPTADGGLLVVRCAGGLHGLDPRTGRPLWVADAFGPDGTPALADGVVIQTGACKETAAYARANGATLWRSGAQCGGGGPIAVAAARRVFVIDRSPNEEPGGRVLDVAGGQPLRSFSSSLAPAIAGATGFFVRQEIRAEDVQTGAVRWAVPTPPATSAPPIVAGQHVYLGASDGTVAVFDRATGRALQRLAAPAGPTTDEIGRTPITGLSVGSGRLVVPSGTALHVFAGKPRPKPRRTRRSGS